MIVLTSLLSESRMQRMQEAQALYGKPAYSIGELVSEVTQGVWSEVDAKEPVSTVYRRVLQRSYLKTIDGKINGANASKTDLKPMAIAELKRLAARIDKAIPKTKDTETAAHLLASRSDIEKILQGKFSTGSSSGSIYDFLYGLNSNNPPACWAENKTLIEAIRDASR
jgi:hypothetical protein